VDTGACADVDPSSIVSFHIQNLGFVMQAEVVHGSDRLIKVHSWDQWARVAPLLLFPTWLRDNLMIVHCSSITARGTVTQDFSYYRYCICRHPIAPAYSARESSFLHPKEFVIDLLITICLAQEGSNRRR
jgi:hypothetical protein